MLWIGAVFDRQEDSRSSRRSIEGFSGGHAYMLNIDDSSSTHMYAIPSIPRGEMLECQFD